MDKPKQCVTNGSKWKNGLSDGGRRPLRRGSVDSGLNGIYQLNLQHVKEKTSEKKGNETKSSPSYVTSKKDKDSKGEGSPRNKSSCSSNKLSSIKTKHCQTELRPILKSGRSSRSLEEDSPTSDKEKQTTETKFSYRLPTAPRPTIRKSVSFREEDTCSRRRFSSPSLTFPLETKKTG